MGHPRRNEAKSASCEIVDFDEVLLSSCSLEMRTDLLMEARLLASVCAPGADAAVLAQIAAQLSAGQRDGEMSRAHARRVAAALKRLAKGG
jgi:hypothetical protein